MFGPVWADQPAFLCAPLCLATYMHGVRPPNKYDNNECKNTHTYRIAPGRYVLSWQHIQMTTKEGEYCLPLVQQGAIYLSVAHERRLFT